MFIPYRVIQIKQNRYPSHRYPSHRDKLGLNEFHLRNNKSTDRHQICNSKQHDTYLNINQSLQRYQKNSIHSHDKSFKKSEQKQSSNIYNPEAQFNIYRSLDFNQGAQNKNKQLQNCRNRPASSSQPHRTLSKKYKSTSIQNQTVSPAIIKKVNLKPKRKITNRTFESQCYGWNAVHNIYEHEGKQFYFNFSKNLDSDNLFSRKKTLNSNYKKKQSSHINKNNSLQPKKSNLFDVYIKQIRNKKQRANVMGFSQELRKRDKNQKLIVFDGTEQRQRSEKQEAKLIDLQQTYWQWKGYFATTRRPKSQKKKNMSQKNKQKGKRKNDFGDCKIDGWQVQPLQTKELQSPTHEGEQHQFFIS